MNSVMRERAFLLLVLCGIVAAACGNQEKGGAVDTKMAGDYATCKEDRDKAKNALSSCQKDFDVLKNSTAGNNGTGDGTGDVYLVKLDGDLMTISGHTKNGVAMPVAPAQLSDEELKVTESVTVMIRGSKNSIQACYVNALKTNTDMANRTISLEVRVVVNPSGKITNQAFSPNVSPQFDACMRTVAGRWVVNKYNGKAFPIAVTIKLENK